MFSVSLSPHGGWMCRTENRTASLPSFTLHALLPLRSNLYYSCCKLEQLPDLPVSEEWMENQGFVIVNKYYSYSFSLVPSRPWEDTGFGGGIFVLSLVVVLHFVPDLSLSDISQGL